MCVCVCVCVCVYVCLYFSTIKTSFVCNDFLDILDRTDQRSYVEVIILDTSAKSLHLSFWIYHVSHPKAKFQPSKTRKENDMVYAFRKKVIYIDIGYKLNHAKLTNDEKILNIKRLL